MIVEPTFGFEINGEHSQIKKVEYSYVILLIHLPRDINVFPGLGFAVCDEMLDLAGNHILVQKLDKDNSYER